MYRNTRIMVNRWTVTKLHKCCDFGNFLCKMLHMPCVMAQFPVSRDATANKELLVSLSWTCSKGEHDLHQLNGSWVILSLVVQGSFRPVERKDTQVNFCSPAKSLFFFKFILSMCRICACLVGGIFVSTRHWDFHGRLLKMKWITETYLCKKGNRKDRNTC